MYVDCMCGMHALKITCWLDYHGENNELYYQEFGVSVFENSSIGKTTFFDRLKFAWRYLRKGSLHDDQVLLDSVQAEKLEDFIRENKFAGCISGDKLQNKEGYRDERNTIRY